MLMFVEKNKIASYVNMLQDPNWKRPDNRITTRVTSLEHHGCDVTLDTTLHNRSLKVQHCKLSPTLK